MSKIDLEPLVCLKRARMDVERGNCEYNVTDYLDTIEAALLELKEIKKTKSSDAMEDLKELEEILSNQKLKYKGIIDFNLDTIKNYILKSQEQEKPAKSFEIVKTKNLFMELHKYCFEYAKNDYNLYCRLFQTYKLDKKYLLTEDEFNLLKETLD